MTSASVQFRWAVFTDVDAIVALVQSAYRGESSRDGWTTEADLLEGQRTDATEVGSVVAAEDSRMLLAEIGDALLACALLRRTSGAMYLGMFAVRPDRQAAGVGRTMLDEAERIARDDWQVTSIEMTVISARTELIEWYERRGFVRTGELSPFPYGDLRFGEPTRDGLEFERLVKSLAG